MLDPNECLTLVSSYEFEYYIVDIYIAIGYHRFQYTLQYKLDKLWKMKLSSKMKFIICNLHECKHSIMVVASIKYPLHRLHVIRSFKSFINLQDDIELTDGGGGGGGGGC